MSSGLAAALPAVLATWASFAVFVIGALVGYGIQFALAALVRGGMQRAQGGFLDSTFAVMGALSKADGVPSSNPRAHSHA